MPRSLIRYTSDGMVEVYADDGTMRSITRAQFAADEAGEIAATGNGIAEPVPAVISRSQALMALRLTPSPISPAPATLYDDISGYIQSLDLTLPNPAEPDYAANLVAYQQNIMVYTAWNEEHNFERTSPAINGIGATLGLTSAQLDDLFRQADALNV